jgi:hypothetical protein
MVRGALKNWSNLLWYGSPFFFDLVWSPSLDSKLILKQHPEILFEY